MVRSSIIIIISLLMSLFAADAGNGTDSSTGSGELEHEEQMDDAQAIKEIERNMKNSVTSLIKKIIMPHLLSTGTNKNISGPCISSMLKIVGGFRQLQEWAVRFIDSSGKLPPGILEGTSLSLGDYDQCLDIAVGKRHNPPTSAADVLFRGHYCLLQLHRAPAIQRSVADFRSGNKNAAIAKTKTFFNIFVRYKNIESGDFKLGICIPSTCTKQDLETALGPGGISLIGKITVAYCKKSEDNERTVEQSILLGLFGFMCGCLVLGTTADLYLRCCITERKKSIEKPNYILKVIRSVSLYSNAVDLFDTSHEHEPMKFLCGLRTIIVFITIYGHTYGHIHELHFQKFTRPMNFLRFFQSFAFSGISNGSVGMDTVIFISAVTITYRRWRNMPKESNISLKIPDLLLQRYFRLTLAQLLAIGIFLLVPLQGSGPLWSAYMDPLLDNCRDRWWLNVLYIGNFWSSRKTCLYHTWVLAVIMQLTVLGAFIIWILKRSPRAGILFMIILIFGGIIAVAIMTAINDLPGSMAFFMLDARTGPLTWRNVYTLAYDHVGPFCIGLLTGYFLAKKERTLEIRRHHAAILWCIAVACNTAVIFGLYRYRNGLKMEMSLSAFYAVMHRNVWAMGIAWLVIACATGHGGPVTRVLSAKIFVPLDRLCYMAFLLHLPIMFYHSGTIRERWYMGHLEMYVRAMAYMTISFTLSCFTYLMFQRPYFFLESELRALWKRRDKMNLRKISTLTTSSATSAPQPNSVCVNTAYTETTPDL